VAHAVKVYFVCNGDEVMASTSEDHLVDPETSIRYTKIRLEVKKSDAMDVLGKFVCRCHAASNKGEVTSSDASVSVACKIFGHPFLMKLCTVLQTVMISILEYLRSSAKYVHIHTYVHRYIGNELITLLAFFTKKTLA
jgi:hypothetical protein